MLSVALSPAMGSLEELRPGSEGHAGIEGENRAGAFHVTETAHIGAGRTGGVHVDVARTPVSKHMPFAIGRLDHHKVESPRITSMRVEK